MVRLRKDNSVLVYGKYTLLDEDNLDTYAYTRELEGRKLLVLLNFSSKKATVKTDYSLSKAKILIGNYQKPSLSKTLQPYEAVILELAKK